MLQRSSWLLTLLSCVLVSTGLSAQTYHPHQGDQGFGDQGGRQQPHSRSPAVPDNNVIVGIGQPTPAPKQPKSGAPAPFDDRHRDKLDFAKSLIIDLLRNPRPVHPSGFDTSFTPKNTVIPCDQADALDLGEFPDLDDIDLSSPKQGPNSKPSLQTGPIVFRLPETQTSPTAHLESWCAVNVKGRVQLEQVLAQLKAKGCTLDSISATGEGGEPFFALICRRWKMNDSSVHFLRNASGGKLADAHRQLNANGRFINTFSIFGNEVVYGERGRSTESRSPAYVAGASLKQFEAGMAQLQRARYYPADVSYQYRGGRFSALLKPVPSDASVNSVAIAGQVSDFEEYLKPARDRGYRIVALSVIDLPQEAKRFDLSVALDKHKTDVNFGLKANDLERYLTGVDQQRLRLRKLIPYFGSQTLNYATFSTSESDSFFNPVKAVPQLSQQSFGEGTQTSIGSSADLEPDTQSLTLVQPRTAELTKPSCCSVHETKGHSVDGLQLWGAGPKSDDYWNHTNLKIRFLEGTTAQKNAVIEYAREWEKHCGLRFDFGEHRPADVRIAFGGKDVNFYGKQTPDATWSQVGPPSNLIKDDQPTMNYGFSIFQKKTWTESDLKEIKRNVLHEFGHAIGLYHEHKNPSAPFRWDFEGIKNELRTREFFEDKSDEYIDDFIERNIVGATKYDSINSTTYDPLSIMVYPVRKEWNKDGIEVELNYSLSRKDIDLIGEMYPKASSIKQFVVEGSIYAEDDETFGKNPKKTYPFSYPVSLKVGQPWKRSVRVTAGGEVRGEADLAATLNSNGLVSFVCPVRLYEDREGTANYTTDLDAEGTLKFDYKDIGLSRSKRLENRGFGGGDVVKLSIKVTPKPDVSVVQLAGETTIIESRPNVVSGPYVFVTNEPIREHLESFARLKKRRAVPIYLVGRSKNETTLLDHAWQLVPESDRPNWHFHTAISDAEFSTIQSRYTAAGYRIVSHTTYIVGGRKLHTGVWHQGGRMPQIISYASKHAADHQATANKLSNEFLPIYASRVSDAGNVLVDAIWQRSAGIEWELRGQLSATQFENKHRENLTKGQKLEWYQTYQHNGAKYRLGLWTDRSSK